MNSGKFFKHLFYNIITVTLAAALLCLYPHTGFAKTESAHKFFFSFSPLEGLKQINKLERNLSNDSSAQSNLAVAKDLYNNARPNLSMGFTQETPIENGIRFIKEFHIGFGMPLPKSLERMLGFDQPLITNNYEGLQVGGGVGFDLGQGLSSKLSFDTGIKGNTIEQRGLFRIVASW